MHHHTTFALALAAALCTPLAQAQPTGRLNDTGQALCYDGSATMVACTSANTGDGATYPRQDGRFGRDRAGMAKVGGAAGFDFTKLCWNGDAEGSGTCTGTLVANTSASASGTPGTDWACTKDNHTNLIWSLQSVSGIGWNGATSTAGGSPIAAHNGASRCGHATGWRVPTRRELLSIVHHGAYSPAIDGAYFPFTLSIWYWTNDRYAPGPSYPSSVNFDYGNANAYDKTNANHVRLVRSGQ